ncbi:holo-[acyl-carrier-protein] synthase [Clostridium tetani]|uniref:Holo-[acyl-carrier-protein] synthase n=1 Tax=Clostridium tetani TaxID=1513 RepID=A0A4Q0VDE4_CLOTA|nr:holo-ACP synthase [Clostridium tetani]RXI48212.1 holo-ACP synthase [Clostridium tetani]BDR68255.1 holo-[acyl-carrier-protein] synthase [Clostridium tetani]BDR70869.1 holo-[acyl-carrier-protein] synthase [Clostridium tetani]BDR73814.1 holo-[acyl-carrier-protein] synthase [Clostridium tetani]BDR82186.1 holo-[acyl-carrier-protein] synthase [Clostridium tetani]
MILGIGIDIIEIIRIKNAIERNSRFMKRVFTEKEIKYFEKINFRHESIAGRFAAKEAIVKALGTGFRNMKITDIEVINDKVGKPLVELKGGALEKIKVYKDVKIHLSISHNRDNAIAYSIIEGECI